MSIFTLEKARKSSGISITGMLTCCNSCQQKCYLGSGGKSSANSATDDQCSYLHSVVDSPHENREKRVIGTEEFSLGVFYLEKRFKEKKTEKVFFYLEPFSLHLGHGALHFAS